MSLRYSHVLIPKDLLSTPSVSQMVDFLSAGPEWVEILEHRLVNYDDPSLARTTLGSSIEVKRDAKTLKNFNLAVFGKCSARKSPLIAMGGYAGGKWSLVTGDFHFELSCAVRPQAVSMSDLHEECRIERMPAQFGELPKNGKDPDAYYTHPETHEILAIEDAGSASFWIELSFGSWMVPRVDDGIAVKRSDRRDGAVITVCELQLITEPFRQSVRDTLGIEFVEGFRWS